MLLVEEKQMNQISDSMNRRDFLKLTAASTAALALPGCTSASQRPRCAKNQEKKETLTKER